MMEAPKTIFSLLQTNIYLHHFNDSVNAAQLMTLALKRGPYFNTITDLILADVLNRVGLDPASA